MNLLIHNYLTRGFWGDESWTALISKLPISEIIRVTGEDFHPPLYYFIVHFWGGLFGFGEVTLRLISIFFFLLTSLIVFFLTQSFFSSLRTSFLSTLLVLLSPILFTYAFETRSYALLAFLTTLSALCFWQARTAQGHFWRISYALVGAISVYTHYYSWFILASHGIFILIFERHQLKKLFPAALSILLVQLPWLPTLFSQIGQVNRDYWIAPMTHHTHWEFFLRVAGGDHPTDLQHAAAFLILFFVLAGIYHGLRFKTPRLPTLFLLTWIIIPILLPSIISLRMPIFFYRYLIFSAIPLLLLTVQGLLSLPQKTWIFGLSLLVIQYLFINFHSFRRYDPSFREQIQSVYQTKTPGDSPIYTVLPSFAEVTYYFGPTDEIIVLDEGLVQFSGKSLLDSYERQGLTHISPPPDTPYWFLEPGPQANFIHPLTPHP